MSNILIIEPFFTGSHQAWAKQYQRHSSHHIKILSMKGRFWKWRMYGGAVTLAQEYMNMDFTPDVILATDMLDLTTFLALIRNKETKLPVVALYFHENQLAYPWNIEKVDVMERIHYGFMNYTSALAADQIFFNSHHNMRSFYGELETLLRKMPDYKHTQVFNDLMKKSEVLPIGMELQKTPQSTDSVYSGKEPLILWNHRWEFDKNPEDFFNALFILKKEGLTFKVCLLGEQYKNSPSIFEEAQRVLRKDIIKIGYVKGIEYFDWLWAADLLPVTSRHDFFGISVMEAIYCGCYPLLPNRLTYPDLYQIENHPEIFYNDFPELVEKLKDAVSTFPYNKNHNYAELTFPFDWDQMVTVYDAKFTQLIKYENLIS